MSPSVPDQIAALEQRCTQLEAIIRAILTVLHPIPAGEDDFRLEASEAQHTLLHQCLTTMGGRVPLPPDTMVR